MNVHFICRGNAHRSVMAEAYLKSLNLPNVTVFSSGTVADLYREPNLKSFKETTDFLATRGISQYAKKASEQLTQDRFHENDVTVCVNQIAYDEGSQSVTFPKDTIVWDISDTNEGHRLLKPGDLPTMYDEEIFQQIKTNIDDLVVKRGLTKSL